MQDLREAGLMAWAGAHELQELANRLRAVDWEGLAQAPGAPVAEVAKLREAARLAAPAAAMAAEALQEFSAAEMAYWYRRAVARGAAAAGPAAVSRNRSAGG